MRRGRFGSLPHLAAVAALVWAANLGATEEIGDHRTAAPLAILDQFLSLADPSPTAYQAVRHMTAHNGHFDSTAWMDVRTFADENGFRFDVLNEGGSSYIRSHVFLPTLEAEQKMWRSPESGRGALTPANYVFEDAGAVDGLRALAVKPRRSDMFLIDGQIFLRPDDGELMRIEGRPSRSPSFWTRRIHIVRWYERIAGVRLPVRFESVADVRIAGPSSFAMTYAYESVNGRAVEQ